MSKSTHLYSVESMQSDAAIFERVLREKIAALNAAGEGSGNTGNTGNTGKTVDPGVPQKDPAGGEGESSEADPASQYAYLKPLLESDVFTDCIVFLTDEEGNNFKLEIVGEVEYEDDLYRVFLPTDMDEDDPDYGFIILKSVMDGDEELLDSVDDEELLEKVYAIYMEEVFSDEDEAETED